MLNNHSVWYTFHINETCTYSFKLKLLCKGARNKHICGKSTGTTENNVFIYSTKIFDNLDQLEQTAFIP